VYLPEVVLTSMKILFNFCFALGGGLENIQDASIYVL